MTNVSTMTNLQPLLWTLNYDGNYFIAFSIYQEDDTRFEQKDENIFHAGGSSLQTGVFTREKYTFLILSQSTHYFPEWSQI